MFLQEYASYTLALSKLNYCVSNLELPEWATTQTKAIFYDFLWSGKPPRVKNSVITNKIEEGGLRMTNIDNYVLAQKAGWVKRLLLNKETVPYHYLKQFMPGISLEHFLKCSMSPEDLPLMIPLFYRQVLYAWLSLKPDPQNSFDVQREILWLNKNIKIDRKYILEEKLYNAGLIFVNDMLTDYGSFLRYLEFNIKFNTNTSHMYYMSLIDAIPQQWRKYIKLQRPVIMNPQGEEIYVKLNQNSKPIYLTTTKEIYWYLTDRSKCKPTCIENWSIKYNVEYSDAVWKKIFSLSSNITLDT
jgi:hypothetical protein